jgi:hypothetical protein
MSKLTNPGLAVVEENDISSVRQFRNALLPGIRRFLKQGGLNDYDERCKNSRNVLKHPLNLRKNKYQKKEAPAC